MAKTIDFFDGALSETTPTIGSISATNLASYPDDAAYVLDNGGSAGAGDAYYNTTINAIRFYDAGSFIWRTIETGIDSKVEYRTLTSGEALVKQLNLLETPLDETKVRLYVAGAPNQVYGTDFIVTGVVLSWDTLALDGVLSAGDQIFIEYEV